MSLWCLMDYYVTGVICRSQQHEKCKSSAQNRQRLLMDIKYISLSLLSPTPLPLPDQLSGGASFSSWGRSICTAALPCMSQRCLCLECTSNAPLRYNTLTHTHTHYTHTLRACFYFHHKANHSVQVVAEYAISQQNVKIPSLFFFS